MSSPEQRGVHLAVASPGGRVGVAEPRKAPPLETPKTRKKKANPILRGLMALGILTAGGAVAYETIPAVNQTVNKGIERVFGNEVPSTFNNSADSGTIGNNNIVRMTREEIRKLPSFDKNGKPILSFNFVPPTGKTIEYIKRFQGGFVHPGIEVDGNTTRNSMELMIPAGTVIASSIDGRVFIGNDRTKRQDELSTIFMGEDGLLYSLGMGSEEIEDGAFQPLVNAPKGTEANRGGKQWEEGFSASENQGLVMVTKDIKVSMLLQGGLNGTLYGPRLESNLQFKIASDKLVLPQS